MEEQTTTSLDQQIIDQQCTEEGNFLTYKNQIFRNKQQQVWKKLEFMVIFRNKQQQVWVYGHL